MDVEIAAKIDYLGTGFHNVLMNFWLAITINHSKSAGLLFSNVWLCCLCICCVIQESS